jgi:hypothetical protein
MGHRGAPQGLDSGSLPQTPTATTQTTWGPLTAALLTELSAARPRQQCSRCRRCVETSCAAIPCVGTQCAGTQCVHPTGQRQIPTGTPCPLPCGRGRTSCAPPTGCGRRSGHGHTPHPRPLTTTCGSQQAAMESQPCITEGLRCPLTLQARHTVWGALHRCSTLVSTQGHLWGCRQDLSGRGQVTTGPPCHPHGHHTCSGHNLSTGSLLLWQPSVELCCSTQRVGQHAAHQPCSTPAAVLYAWAQAAAIDLQCVSWLTAAAAASAGGADAHRCRGAAGAEGVGLTLWRGSSCLGVLGRIHRTAVTAAAAAAVFSASRAGAQHGWGSAGLEFWQGVGFSRGWSQDFAVASMLGA